MLLPTSHEKDRIARFLDIARTQRSPLSSLHRNSICVPDSPKVETNETGVFSFGFDQIPETSLQKRWLDRGSRESRAVSPTQPRPGRRHRYEPTWRTTHWPASLAHHSRDTRSTRRS